jgi:anthranilate synthase/aminodeoxychorismate synthase-like glutamine amidotransferase
MILIIDNYDSFVHNLARYVREAGRATMVVRNDAGTAGDLLQCDPEAVILSPGPKAPQDAGVCLSLIRTLSRSAPLLGVCLGHQCLVEAFGGRTVKSIEPLHGEASFIRHDGDGLFAGVENPFPAGRYHSLVSELAEGGPLVACATSARGELMAVRHRTAPWHGVQFHPESLLTPAGRTLIGNFLSEIGRKAAA